MKAARPVHDRSRPPVPGRPATFAFPAFRHARLGNGLRILAARSSRVPLASLQILMPAGGQVNALGEPGLASLHGSLLDEGTAQRSALDIARRIEGLGGSVASGAGWNAAYVEVVTLAQHLDSGRELLAEMVREPALPGSEIDRLKQETRAEILRREGDPSALSARFFARAVYRGTVYGEPLIGTRESLERFDRDSLVSFNTRHVGPGGATVVAVGDFDPEAEVARIEGAFADWRPSPPPPPPVIEPREIKRTEIHVVDRPAAAQVQLRLGHACAPRNHPDFPGLLLINTAFGGKFTSRINLNLREKHGFTYGAHSSFARRLGPGPFAVTAAVATDVAGAAVEQLLLEIRRVVEQPLEPDELRETQDYLVGVFPYTLQTIDDLARRLEVIAVFDLPLDYYDRYPAVLYELDRDVLLETARRHLRPDRAVIVAVGPGEALVPQLEGFGPVTVHQP